MTVGDANLQDTPLSDNDLVVLVYTSAATRDLSREELATMLDGTRKRNARRGVTGLLLFHDGCFMQAIEGPRFTVHALLAKVSRDSRHGDIIVLLEERRTERQFPDHSMAYRDMSTEDLPEGHRGLFNDGLRAEHFRGHPDRVHRLLQIFADTQLRRRR